MKISNGRLFYVFVAIAILLPLILALDGWYHRYIQRHPQMFCYDSFRKTDEPVSVIFLSNRRYSRQYIWYYKEVEAGNNPYLPAGIMLQGVGANQAVYVLKYSDDSLLAKIAMYGSGRTNDPFFETGWVYSKTLHAKPHEPGAKRKRLGEE